MKAEADGDNEAQTAANKSVRPFVLLLPLFPLLRPDDRDGFKEGMVLVSLPTSLFFYELVEW